MPGWKRAEAFRRHAEGLPVVASSAADMDAVVTQRSLLSETDQVRPIVAALGAALREVLVRSHETLTDAAAAARTRLAADATWSKLDASGQNEICRSLSLDVPAPLATGTDGDLLRALDARSLAGWRSEIDAVDARAGQALQAAARLVDAKTSSRGEQPADGTSPDPPRTTTVEVRRGTLADDTAVREWVREQESKLMEAIRTGPVIVR